MCVCVCMANGGIQLISPFTYVHIRKSVMLLNEAKSIHAIPRCIATKTKPAPLHCGLSGHNIKE